MERYKYQDIFIPEKNDSTAIINNDQNQNQSIRLNPLNSLQAFKSIKMYLKQSFIASMAVLFPAALASITCQTTSGSPVLSDVTDCINYFNGQSKTFEPDPFASSGCTTYGKVEGAAVALCSKVGYTGPEIGGHALDIQNACLSDGRVGGYKDLGDGNKIEVIHS